MAGSKNKKNQNDQILHLKTQIKHLTNELRLTREEYETATKNYFDMYSNMERRIQERITESKKLQKMFREKSQQLQIILDSSPIMIYFKDGQKKFIRVNKKFSRTIGIPIKKLIGKTYAELFPDNIGHILEDDSEVIKRGEPVLNRNGYIETYEGRIEILIDKIPYKDIDNNVTGIIGFARDITGLKRAEEEKKKLEAQLQRVRKMEAVGTLAGGVAHDLNNILSGIVSVPELLLMQLPEDSPLRHPISIMEESGQKAAAVVQDLLTLARRGAAPVEVVNLNDIICKYLKSLEHGKLKSYQLGVEVETDLDAGLLNILGSHVHLSKTVMNLVSNAAEAMPEGGKVRISTENRYIDRPIHGYEGVKEGDYITLMVSDSGVGISSKDIERIFEPFFTKKRMGRSGTGLGMAVVWGTVKDHRGYIDVQSKEGKGTTFTLYFPATRQEIDKEKVLLSIEDYKGRGESILVVDDIKEQREIASNMLTVLGYEVDAVSSGEEAIEYVKGNPVNLIVLDMIMEPGIDGLGTYKRILEVQPVQRAIIVSGFSETDRVKKTQRLGAGAYIRKPYTLEKIGVAVRSELTK